MGVPYKIQQEASAFRRENGISPTDPIKLPSLLIKLGVIAVFKPLSDKFSGMAIKQHEHKFMLINSSHRISKQNFTVAHELYHLFIQTEFTSEISNAGRFDKTNVNEYHADCFAAYLLMPDDGILQLIPEPELKKNQLSIATIVKIEQYFGCSRTAVLIRIAQIGLIDWGKYEHCLQSVKQSAAFLGYDLDLYEPGNDGLIIGDYGVKAKRLFDKDKISESHFINLMNDIGIDILSLNEDNEQE